MASETAAHNAGNVVLVTGCAGFIGFHVCLALAAKGHTIVGIDDLNPYYDPALKRARLAKLKELSNFSFEHMDVADNAALSDLFKNVRPTTVIHLAAQAGVRYSLTNPHAYTRANIEGFLNILEGCRHNDVQHLTYASSSSVYGANTSMPFSVHDNVDHPVSLYAATKKANELMAHTYSHLYGLPTTGLRFFTVFGPWGRPDMALFIFTKAILEGKPIDVFNNGEMRRDFTYIDDIVDGVLKTSALVAKPNSTWNSATPDPATSKAPYRVYNIGNNQPVALLDMIACVERALGKEAKKNFLPLQPGDVPQTYANVEALEEATGFKPSTPLDVGVKRFVDWYRDFYQV